MRLLLDESVPSRLRRSLASHEVRTVGEMGWSGTKNGKLLALAGADFDAFVTVDKNLAHNRTWPAFRLLWFYSMLTRSNCRHCCL